jgi:plastocyanin
MRRMLGTAAMALLLVASACSSGPKGAQSYAVDADAKTPPAANLQVSAFFPGSVSANAGDTIVFTNRSMQAPHTITFGVSADRKNQPQLVLPTGENPVDFEPCYSEDNPTPQLATCPHKELPDYNGAGFWNSGVLPPAPAPAAAGSKSVTVKLSKDIAAGSYTFLCVLHPFMAGTLKVVAKASDRLDPKDVSEQRETSSRKEVATAVKIAEPQLQTNANGVTVSAGWGDRVTAVNRFGPASVDIKVGQTVSWVGRSPFEPHTVTFESPYKTAGESFVPAGVKSGASYTGGLANSGLFGPKGGPFPADHFDLKFTKAGSYKYICTLHAGMEGVVKVS